MDNVDATKKLMFTCRGGKMGEENEEGLPGLGRLKMVSGGEKHQHKRLGDLKRWRRRGG